MRNLTQFFGAAALVAATLTPAYADNYDTADSVAPTFPNAYICDRSKLGSFENFAECDSTLHYAQESVRRLKDYSEISPYVRIFENETQSCISAELDHKFLLNNIFNRITQAGSTQSVLDNAVILPEELDQYVLILESRLACANDVSGKLDYYDLMSHKPAYDLYKGALTSAIDALTPE